MNSLNQTITEGNITKDAVLRICKDGGNFFTFTIACNKSEKDEMGNYKDIPMFFDVSFYNKSSFYTDKLNKGTKVVISGRLDVQKWAKEGTEYKKICIVANSIVLCTQRAKIQDDAPVSNVAPTTDEDVPF